MEEGDNRPSKVRTILAVGGLIAAIAIGCGTDLQPGNPAVSRMAGVAVLMATLWLTEIIPIAITALLPLVLFPLLGIASGEIVAREYSQDVIFVFVGGFLMALAMERWGLHRRIALAIVSRFGGTDRRLLLGFMLATAFLSMWISNTAAAMIMVTIALAVVQTAETRQGQAGARPLAVALLLGVAYSATIGGIATPVGTPPNLVFIQLFHTWYPEGPPIGFLQWMLFALPITVLLLFCVWLLLSWTALRRGARDSFPRQFLRDEYQALGRIEFAEWMVMIAFLVLVLLWTTRASIDLGGVKLFGWSEWFGNPKFITDGTVAIGVASLLFFISARDGKYKILDWETAVRLPWGIVLLFGGGFALASGFVHSGLSAWLGDRLQGLENWPLIGFVAAMCLGICFVSEFTSNTATTQLILPILAALAAQMEIHPLMILLPATIACSWGFMLPVGTPPNAIVFGTNRLRMREMASIGFWVNLIAVAITVAAIFGWGRGVWGLTALSTPDWAR